MCAMLGTEKNLSNVAFEKLDAMSGSTRVRYC